MEKNWSRGDRNYRGNFRKKRDFSGPEYYNDDWGKKKTYKKYSQREEKVIEKREKFSVIENLAEINEVNFSWIKNCIA